MRYRVIDTAGGEIGLVDDDRDELADGDRIALPDGSTAEIVEIYDGEDGTDGGVAATLVVEER